MKKLLLFIIALTSVTLARADFLSFTLVSETDPLTYTPVTSFTYDTLSVNFTGNSDGASNYTLDGQAGAVVTFSFTTDYSIIGHTVQLAWTYPDSSSVFEFFPTIVVPGTVFLGFGASDYTVTGNTITISNSTYGWTGAAFNGFVLTDFTQRDAGPSAGAPDATSTLPLLAIALAGMVIGRRGKKFALR